MNLAFTISNQRYRRRLHILLASLLALCLLLELPASLWAHPLGNFTVNRYSRLELDGKQVHLFYVIDMAEIPTHQDRTLMDTNGDDQISQTEQDQYLAHQVSMLQSNAHLTINGAPITWLAQASHLEFLPGQANLPILRLTARYVAPLPANSAIMQAAYDDENYADRIGWHEVIVRASADATLLKSSVSEKDLSNELRNYPADLLQSPEAVNTASFEFKLQAAASSNAATSASTTNAVQSSTNSSLALRQAASPFADRMAMPILGPLALLLALLAAFGYGAAHALTPGHGKTIVGAYLVGSRGTVWHALFLGITTTITHTAGIFAIGLLTWFASRFILPEKIFPWLSVISGLLVVVIGLSMVWAGLRNLLKRPGQAQDTAHDHSDLFAQGQLDNFVHAHGSGPAHSHLPPGANGAPLSWRSLLVLGVSGGLVPCPDALVGMLGAIALQRIGFGLVMLIAYSLGLASVLTVIGILLVHSGKLFQRIPESGRVLRLMPVASALFITIVGIGIAWQAFMQTGLFTIG